MKNNLAKSLLGLAGAKSIFIGAKLLTTPLAGEDKDRALLADLGMRAMGEDACSHAP